MDSRLRALGSRWSRKGTGDLVIDTSPNHSHETYRTLLEQRERNQPFLSNLPPQRQAGCNIYKEVSPTRASIARLPSSDHPPGEQSEVNLPSHLAKEAAKAKKKAKIFEKAQECGTTWFSLSQYNEVGKAPILVVVNNALRSIKT